MIEKKLHSIELIDNMSKEQIRDYWYELKQARYDGIYYREMFENIKKMNPNLVMPDGEIIGRIQKEALAIAFWEENWEQLNKKRVKNGGTDYSIFQRDSGHHKIEIPVRRRVM